jgi:hypothetical protein
MSSDLKRRRSPRIAEERPIELTGTNVEGIDFLAPSRTVLLSRYGAKIRCEQVMEPGQEITLYHQETGEYCLAKVVGLYDRLSGEYSYGIEFLDPDRDFWNVAFPTTSEVKEVTLPAKPSQREPRRRKTVRVAVYGTDRHGNPISQTAYSVNVSRSGACLDGVGFLTAPGVTIEVKHGRKKARFRVVWVGKHGANRVGRAGMRCLEPETNIWEASSRWFNAWPRTLLGS